MSPTAFHVEPSAGLPIHRQLMDQVLALRASGRARPGDEVPSVRKLAAALGVNPATVSKAWARLEADGVLERQPGRGMTLAQPPAPPAASAAERRSALRPLVDAAVIRGRQLGLTDPQIAATLAASLKEHPDAETLRASA